MTHTNWPVRLALGLTLLLTAACGQLGGPQRVAQGDPGGGIGGTGGAAEPARQVGILGTVRGFGSVRVNGVTVQTGDALTVDGPFGPRTPDALAPGHVVEISAEARGDRLTARRMAQLVALAGPVQAVRPADRALSVMGVEVQLAGDAPVGVDGGLAALSAGDRVAVSGLWRAGGVVASRIDPLAGDPARDRPAAAGAVVSGVVRSDGAERRIGPLRVRGAGDVSVPADRFAVLTGRYRDGRFVASEVAAGHPVLPPTLDRLSVEAYAGKVHGGPALHGFGHPVAPGTRLERLHGRRAVFIGPLANAFLIEHGVPLPGSLNAQRDALRAIGDGLQPERGAVETR
jgi:hypothetical protein